VGDGIFQHPMLKAWIVIVTQSVGSCLIGLVPHITNLFSNIQKSILAFMIPYLPRMYNPSCHNINPLYIEIVVSIVGATCKRWGGVGWSDWPKHHGFTNAKLKTHVK
jgi:hypothetical protein